MAKGKWREIMWEDGRPGFTFVIGSSLPKGHVTKKTEDGNWLAVVYPENSGCQKTVADNVTEAEAKAAVEEYWADNLAA